MLKSMHENSAKEMYIAATKVMKKPQRKKLMINQKVIWKIL